MSVEFPNHAAMSNLIYMVFTLKGQANKEEVAVDPAEEANESAC